MRRFGDGSKGDGVIGVCGARNVEIGAKIIEDAIAPEPLGTVSVYRLPYHNLMSFDLYQLGSMYYPISHGGRIIR